MSTYTDLAQQPAGWPELDACADDYDVRAEACEQLGQNGQGWRVRASRLRALSLAMRQPPFVVTTSSGTEPAPSGDATTPTDARPDDLIDAVERWLSGYGPILMEHEKAVLREISVTLSAASRFSGSAAPQESVDDAARLNALDSLLGQEDVSLLTNNRGRRLLSSESYPEVWGEEPGIRSLLDALRVALGARLTPAGRASTSEETK